MADLHVCATTRSGELLHTIRHTDGTWQPWDQVLALSGGNSPTWPQEAACAGTGNGDLHICVTRGDVTHAFAPVGELWHTIRFADGTWQSFFEDVNAQVSGGSGIFVGFVDCACDGYGNLHICVTGNSGPKSRDKLWHTIRFADGSWQPFWEDVNAQVPKDIPDYLSTLCCAYADDNLHLFAFANSPTVPPTGGLWHTIRHADGTWDPFDAVNTQPSMPFESFQQTSCSGAPNGDLQLCGLGGGGPLLNGIPWHTIRHADGTWDSVDMNPQALQGVVISCANESNGDHLHICATAGPQGDELRHTIRYADGTWQPFWGDVNAQTSPTPISYKFLYSYLAVFESLRILEFGTWQINANGSEGQLNIHAVSSAIGLVRVEGTVTFTDQPGAVDKVTGTWDETAKQITFIRGPDNPVTQTYTGFLGDSHPVQRLTLAGWFTESDISAAAPRTQFGWFAKKVR